MSGSLRRVDENMRIFGWQFKARRGEYDDTWVAVQGASERIWGYLCGSLSRVGEDMGRLLWQFKARRGGYELSLIDL